jgi:hypothetical protein
MNLGKSNNNVHMEDGAEVEVPGRWTHINKVLDRGGPLAGMYFLKY